ncbi:protein FAR-RED IMPAIRED RESPONSE 1-like [Helianthus annuus]|uniref:protein FAR-RED IMPAIRED RESPONSE 1-like n=1 Tax=Helianthus annuus TaxID=4232 RepID=UPI001652F65D|nr:protein FAR-RED IMPAIRED RESPONSE 1-like [Helianthus annuus]
MDMVFTSLDDFYSMYVKYAKACGFSVRKGTEKINFKGVLHIKYYMCTRAGAGSWKVYKFFEEHNHDLVERPDKHFLPTERHLTMLQKHVIHSMSKLNLGPVKAFNVMKTCFGGFEDVGASKVEFKNYNRQINLFIGEYDADMVVRHLDEKKHSQPNFSYDYFTDGDNRLKGLFWCDDQAKRNYHVFGDVISFDATYRSKKYIMVFVPFTGIDNHHCNVTFGAALLASETADTYTWLLRVFLKVVGSQPKVVVTDQDPAMKKAISTVGVRLCNSTNFKECICGVVWTDILTPEEFESEWEVVIREFNLADNDWLSDILHSGNLGSLHTMEWKSCRALYERHRGRRVMYRKSDCTCSCSCRRFEQFGLLCRHIFYVLRSMDIKEFPIQYILNRWRKEASPNYSPEYSISREYMTELDPGVQSMMRDIIFSTEYTLNRLSGNKGELFLYKDHVQSYMKKVQDMQIVAPPTSTRDRFAEITGKYKNDKNPIKVPVEYKSKGACCRKRLKSKQEIAIEKKNQSRNPGPKKDSVRTAKAMDTMHRHANRP